MRRKITFSTLLFMCMSLSATSADNDGVSVHGTYTYELSENDNMTLREAKTKCIELAKASAIREQFGELVSSDVMDSNVEVNGESVSSYYWENTVAQARGTWLADKRPPLFDITYKDGKLTLKAEVWGLAREIKQAQTELEWTVMKASGDSKVKADAFANGERIYVNFRSPADGYVAIYLLEGNDDTFCLLPYPKDTDGKFPVRGGVDYTLFDKTADPQALYYKMTTSKEKESMEIVVIYSPKPFMKCNDKSKDSRHPNQLKTRDFQKWLLKCQRMDEEMVVNKRWLVVNK